jgi:hypothetical protein
VLQEGGRIRDGERRDGRIPGGADVDRLGPGGDRLAANQPDVAWAGLPGKVNEEAAPERGRRHPPEVRDRGGVVTAAGQDGDEDEQPGEAQSHDSRIG